MDVRKSSSRISPETLNFLARCVLSAFVDHAYLKAGQMYIREGEERSLDRDTILLPDLPDAVAGMPFDLVIERQNQHTGEKEKLMLPLITFSTEISPVILEQLQPFGYEKKQEITLEKNRLVVENTIIFGDITLFQFNSPPDWHNELQKKIIQDSVVSWCERNRGTLKFYHRLEEARKHFNRIKNFLVTHGGQEMLPSLNFNEYWRAFLFEELKRHLKTEDLKLFFDIHPGFLNLGVFNMIPREIIQWLKRMGWPRHTVINGQEKTVIRIKTRPFVKLSRLQFEKVQKEDFILPTGEKAGIIMENRKYSDWDVAVYHFNRWKRHQIFEKKWKTSKKKINARDVAGIPFPLTFHSGQSKENIPFEFFSAPHIEGDDVYLIHFLEKQSAVNYFDSIKPEWDAFLQKQKQRKIESIFREKGWKVK